MHSHVVGGAMLPHAPQFFTMPETEDEAVVARVRERAAEIGRRLRALKPDLWIIFSNDHADQFFHAAAPPFTIHVGGEARGEFAGAGDRAKDQIAEIDFETEWCQKWLPAQMSEAELREAVGKAVAELPQKDPKMAGRVIGAIKKQYGDRADAQLVKKLAEDALKG